MAEPTHELVELVKLDRSNDDKGKRQETMGDGLPKPARDQQAGEDQCLRQGHDIDQFSERDGQIRHRRSFAPQRAEPQRLSHRSENIKLDSAAAVRVLNSLI